MGYPEPLRSISAIKDVLPPAAVLKIPAHRTQNAGIKSLLRAPAQFFSNFRRIDRIAMIVARPVSNKNNLG